MAVGFTVTEKGIEKFNIAASESGKQVKIVEFKAGNGGDVNGEAIDTTLTDVVTPVYTKQFDDNDYYLVDPEYPNRIMISVYLGEEVGPFTINEIGYFDEDGDMICYGIPKVVENKVQGESVTYKNWIVFENEQVENLEIVIDSKSIEQLKVEFQKQFDEINNKLDNKIEIRKDEQGYYVYDPEEE